MDAITEIKPRAAVMTVQEAHAVTFENYLRTGDASNLRELEQKLFQLDRPFEEGGYLAPARLESRICFDVTKASVMRHLAKVVTRPLVANLRPGFQLYAMPSATQSLLDDPALNVNTWLAGETRIAFAEQETREFLFGCKGGTSPYGILCEASVPNVVSGPRTLGHVYSGAAHGFPFKGALDALNSLIMALPVQHRSNAAFLMNRTTLNSVRHTKNRDGNLVWEPAPRAGAPSRLLRYPVFECDDMPDIEHDACPIMFGDFYKGYKVIDYTGSQTLRDPYSAKPYVLFYTTKRVGGGVQDFDAIKLLKIDRDRAS